jgi:hypothetical protein
MPRTRLAAFLISIVFAISLAPWCWGSSAGD